MYFAPGTLGSITTWLLTVLQEMAASNKTTTPEASATIPTAPAARQQCLMNAVFSCGF